MKEKCLEIESNKTELGILYGGRKLKELTIEIETNSIKSKPAIRLSVEAVQAIAGITLTDIIIKERINNNEDRDKKKENKRIITEEWEESWSRNRKNRKIVWTYL